MTRHDILQFPHPIFRGKFRRRQSRYARPVVSAKYGSPFLPDACVCISFGHCPFRRRETNRCARFWRRNFSKRYETRITTHSIDDPRSSQPGIICAERLCGKAVPLRLHLILANPIKSQAFRLRMHEADFILSESKGESARPMVARLYVLLLHHLAI